MGSPCLTTEFSSLDIVVRNERKLTVTHFYKRVTRDGHGPHGHIWTSVGQSVTKLRVTQRELELFR